MAGKNVQVRDLVFKPYIEADRIQERIREIAADITGDLGDRDPIFLAILNGAFMFAADLFKILDFPCQISFLKLASYSGIQTTGNVKQLIGLNQDLSGRVVVVLEDIVDSGITLETISKQLSGYGPAEIRVATLIHKPEATVRDVRMDYVGFEISNEFIVGYGLDYDGYGRNLKEIYQLVK